MTLTPASAALTHQPEPAPIETWDPPRDGESRVQWAYRITEQQRITEQEQQ